MEMGPTMWRATFSEVLTNSDLFEIAKKIRALRKEGPISAQNGLVDLRELSDADIDLNFDTLSTIASEAQDYPLSGEIKIAVMTNSPGQFGFARMFQTLLHHRQVSVHVFFEDEQDALEWISK